ncbi:hypothetical protein [Pseudonocardia endophytica]|uniref:Uncharacterized protein n=1 Tax=Pseudonocardia endophytica TaxID=401976 RepID=A0A4V2PJ76_PSEEN|nr:hypothetical protein [Pseudonocardia endophytica]TCK27476.1 hypothetical protein EV378_3348 [Pseudonocardia endophytica]
MDTFARNALRFSLAGAGVVVLGASYIGQASADEADKADDAPETGSSNLMTADPTAAVPDATSLVALPTVPAPQYLLAPSSLDTFVLPTVSDAVALPEL